MPEPYLIIPVSISVLLCYFFSHVLVWLGIVLKKNHRIFWNVILLITFLITAVLGLLLAIQINYKLEWNLIDKFISWHVNFGIAMALVAIIHFLWHIDYYLKLFRKTPGNRRSELSWNEKITAPFNDRILVILAGFTATILQVLLLRELTTIFQGNEILMTWTIGIWMVLTGTGSYLGRKFRIRKDLKSIVPGLLLIIALVPGFLVILLNLLKNVLFLPGVLISPWMIILIVTIFLSPVCILSGLIFSLFVRGSIIKEKSFIDIYLFESLGSVAGGIVVSFLLIHWFSILQAMFILALFVCLVLYWRIRLKRYLALSAGLILILTLLFFTPVELGFRSVLFSGNEVRANIETNQGNLTVTGTQEEYNVFLNGTLLFNSGNFIRREEFVHYAMLQHNKPEYVLIVSGGIAGMTREILKYSSVKRIDYLEINRKLVDLAQDMELLPDTAILHISYQDVNRFILTTDQQYDVVIMAVPDPSSVQLNRYYSVEFVRRLKTKLQSDGVIIFGLNPSGNYLNKWQVNKLSLICNTLKSEFRNLAIISGEKDYLLASDSRLSTRIGELLSSSSIENTYVNNDYIDDSDLERRGIFIKDHINYQAGLNLNKKALPVFYSTLKYLSQFSSDVKLLLGVPVLLLIILLFLFKNEIRGMYIAGFTGASVEVILIFLFQITFGYIYAAIGMLIAVFMAGLVLGAYLGRKIPSSEKSYRITFLIIIAYLLLLFAFLSMSFSEMSAYILWPVFILLMLIPSTLTGFLYIVTTSLYRSETNIGAPITYAVDLLGSSLAVISMTLLLIPLIGLDNVCIFLIFLNIAPILLSFQRNQPTKV